MKIIRQGLKQQPYTSNRGAALVMTLIIVAMMTILAVAFLVSMQVEQRASHAYANTQRAKMIAQGSVSHAVELLRSNIPEPAQIGENAETAPGENWVSNPGQLTIFTKSGEKKVPLHTGEVDRDPKSTTDPNVYSVDLNEPLPGEEEPMIAMALNDEGAPDYGQENPEMRVKWAPIFRKPGEKPGAENPLIGRYAFWMDDESSKLNFNATLGKPSPTEDDPEQFHKQYKMGLMTPLFRRGAGDVEFNQSSGDREWALGKLRSVNLDVLFDDPNDLDYNQLLAHAWLRGFSRYPEAILDFVHVSDRDQWYAGNKFNLTFYSRSPEFNAFGRPRLFTTDIPLSLEAGPLYQLPFVYDDPSAATIDKLEDGTLHLHSLLGSLGFTHTIDDDVDGRVNAANIVNRAQLEMLMRYFRREWPGYDGASLVQKYGELEAYQMALNMLLMSRMATTTMNNSLNIGSRDWAWRTTSVNYSPHSEERKGSNPERFYWQIEPESQPGKKVPMLPQTPGPHIMEVRMIFKAVQGNNPTKFGIQYRHETEVYMNPGGPVLELWRFPTKVDYFHIKAKGGGTEAEQRFGPISPDAPDAETNPSRNWNHGYTLGRLRATAPRPINIGPRGGRQNSRNRIVVTSQTRAIGNGHSWVPASGGVEFDRKKGSKVKIDLKWRLGMGVNPGWDRPRQMIPLGEEEVDTLDASIDLDLRPGEEYSISWQIIDPRLSWSRDQWVKEEAEDGTAGTPGQLNTGEPGEFSSEKSKFRYIQRGPGSITDPANPGKGRAFGINRPDEYNSRSRVSSIGYWSTIHTGIQNLAPYRTMNLGGGVTPDTQSPPDYVMLDLLGATYPMQHDQWRINSTLPDEFSTISFMHSTAGQINVNSKIYPVNNYFDAPVRKKPLEAVFKHLRSDSEIRDFVNDIVDKQESGPFQYIGEIGTVASANLKGTDATEFFNEAPLRNMAGCLTTKSNCFSVWGVSQVIKKIPGHTEWGEFEDGDTVLAEKRYHAIVERYIWPGKDGIPGNGHFNSQGIWDKLAIQRAVIPKNGSNTDTLFQLPGSPPLFKAGENLRLRLDLKGTYPVFDGPQEVLMGRYTRHALGNVAWERSTLENAMNPPQPVIKYRVVYFKYLDE